MQLTDHVIKQIISDLKKSIALHTDSIENIHSDCNCIKDQTDVKCYHCQLQEVIDDLDCLKSHLEPISLNTVNHLQLIDADAFRYAMENSGMIHSIECFPVYLDPNTELNYPEPKDADSIAINVTTSRFAMDGNGYHVGYEQVTFQWKAMRKSDLNLAGIPRLLSNWVIDPSNYEIIKKDLPNNEDPIHDDDCEFKDSDSFDDCDCAEFWEGYYQPDNDFFYQEMDAIIDQLKYPEAEFNSDNREWQLGDMSFNLDEYQNDDHYADNCNANYGAPAFD
jgi:hypothetical protein